MTLRSRSSLPHYLAICFAALPSFVGAKDVDFARDVRPILAERCQRCHGPKKTESSLRLDSSAAVLRGGDHGPAVVPGASRKSLLIQVVTGKHDELPRMPPKGEPLSASEIEVLRAWIDQGARWPQDPAATGGPARKHWAFAPPEDPEIPQTQDAGWARNAADAFVLARLEKESLSPSPEADRVTLLRRANLDLIGLPPSPADVDAHLGEASPDAHERAVDRLLASPHFGERWGRLWLDAARYADSDGFEKDKSRSVWFYRDWVVEALNRDLPYGEFVVEQLAGDLLPGAAQDQVVATGFLRNSMINEEGGIDPEQFRMEAMFDRMDAIGKSILGLTIQCAQCHSHKFDPLTQEEYYRIFAFLNNDHEANIAVYTSEEEMRRAEVFAKIYAIEADLQHRFPDWEERMARWEEEAQRGQPEWTVVQPAALEMSTGGQKYLPQADGSFLAQGYAPTKHTVEMTVKTEVQNITAFRLELLTDPNLPLGGPGRSIWGTGALTEFEVQAAPEDSPSNREKVKIAKATADVEPAEAPLPAIYDDRSKRRRVTGPVSFAIDGNGDTAWSIDVGPGRRNQERKAVFTAAEAVSHPQGTLLTFFLKQDHGGWNSDDNQNHNLGRFRLSITSAPGAVADPLPRRVREILAIPRSERSQAQTAAVFSFFRTTVPEWKEANERIEALWREHPAGSSQLVLQARPDPRGTHVLKRGDFLKPEKPVGAGTPAFLHPLPDGAPPTRLGFARWLVDRRSPTTARAFVNRVWQACFGTGLVSTSEDLGTQSEPPSHPEILDWLAVRFMDRGWSQKALARAIACSASYRQSSRVTPQLFAVDPQNRLLSRGPRLRVDAELVRDIALAASSLLDPRLGGRSVFPPLPEFMLEPPVSYGPKVWPEEKGADRYRRALYTFRYRSLPFPSLQVFDAPNGDFSCVRRTRSNTPLQALVTLNEPLFLECAQALAQRTLREGGSSDEERTAFAFRACVSRKPASAESAELLSLLEGQRQRLRAGELKAAEIAAFGPSGRGGGAESAAETELAAWTAVSRVLLNLDETITKE
jgi:hypothetical protein